MSAPAIEVVPLDGRFAVLLHGIPVHRNTRESGAREMADFFRAHPEHAAFVVRQREGWRTAPGLSALAAECRQEAAS